MSLYYRTLIQSGLLLDIYPNAAVAYSLRKLREGYKKVFNLLTYSEDISQTTYQKVNLVTTGTPPYIDVVTAPNGTLTADKLIEDTSFNSHFITQTLGITVVGLDYNFSVYLKAGERTKTNIQAGTVGVARINLLTGAIESSTFPTTPIVTDVGNNWWRFSVTFNANSTLLNPLYRIFTVNNLNQGSYVGDGVSGLYVWGFQLTQSSTVLPYEKTVASPETGAAIRVRRASDSTEQDFGFDSSGNLDVNSIEAFVGYNLFAWSEQLQFTYWAKTNLDVTTDTVIAPDSTTTGDILFETTTNGVHTFQRTLAILTGNQYTVSFWIKDEGRNNVRILTASALSWDGFTAPVAWLDLSTGTIVSQNVGFGGTVQITPDGDWYKVSYTVIANSNSISTIIQLNLSPNGSNLSYVGDVTKGISVWGLQVTESSTIRPYRQTLAIAEGDGRISRFFDQSGNGNDLLNGSSGLQYRIVVNGYVYRNTDNGLPAAQVVSTGFYTFTGGNISTSNPLINFNVYKSQPGNMILFGNSSVGGRPVVNLHIGASGSRNIRTRLTNSTGGDFEIPFETNGSFITSTTRDINNVEITVNDNLIGSYTITGGSNNNLTHLGRFNSSANSSAGEIQEMIIWKQNYVSLKSNISDKINEYYGIY